VKLLLDTNTFLWWVADDRRLSRPARLAIADGSNEVLFSAVSAWEIVVKAALGRVELRDSPGVFVGAQIQANALDVLPVLLRHAVALADLPEVHRDPFDRMLVAQAQSEGAAIVTGDAEVTQYPVEIVW
jgi:PIN domain nuclease of toxin-antitoxin system